MDDQDAVQIGQLVRNGSEYWLEAGRRLAIKKDEVGHGHFGKWIEANKGELGFTTLRTAQMLMAAVEKRSLTSPLEPSAIWGNKSTEEKAKRRAERERELGAKQCALPTKKYGVILADPPWRFEPYSRETGMDRAADNHYPTADIEQIAQIHPVAAIAADDCVLFLWATVPMLPHALAVMAVWGFDYRSNMVWFKQTRDGKDAYCGTGYWFRNRHELLLLGVKGHPPAPAPGQQTESAFAAPIGLHSEKPERVLIEIERYFPNLPKIELNRRGPARVGWDCWGLESGEPNAV